MDYKELIQKRRSIRDFEDKQVPDDILQDILNDTRFAPSGCNNQPHRFIIIKDKNLMKKISDDSKKNILDIIKKDPSSPLKMFEKAASNPNFNVFYNAPCLVIFTGKNEYFYFRDDCTLAISYFMFAATQRNLGTCWIALGDQIKSSSLKKEIGLPEDFEVVAPIILGYPKMIPKVSSRQDPIILKTISGS